MRRTVVGIWGVVCCALLVSGASARSGMAFKQDDLAGKLELTMDGKTAFVYNYGDKIDLPHYHPLNTPSGKNLLENREQPYPHHRAFWFADYVSRDGVKANVYNAYYSGTKVGKEEHIPPFDTAVRHLSFVRTESSGTTALLEETLVWETSRTAQAYPLLDEHRRVKITALDNGYFMDMTFTVTAAHGDVEFISDAVHYAWPYLRMNPTFAGTTRGTITADNGNTGQEATNLKPAKWIDYSNVVDGKAEGVAVYQYPDGKEHRWLTREYGTFGPRREDDRSGKPFTLKKDESLSQRVGIYVHDGDVKSGSVKEIYNRYINGKI